MLGAYWYGSAKPFPKGSALTAHLRTLKLHGVLRYIPQQGRDGARLYVQREGVQAACDREGVELVLGLGLDPGSATTPAAHATRCADAIKAALDTVRLVSLDAEGWWNGKRNEAASVAARVLAAHPDAPLRCADAPWWAPLYTIDANGKKRWTHPSWPTAEWGRLVTRRYVQAYGAQADGSPDGRSLSMLRWARSPSQYAAIAAEAGAVWSILPTTQLYARSLNDFVNTLLLEPEQNLWTWNEISSNAKTALRVVAELARRGFVGGGAVRTFQAAARITVDGIVGPQTLYALGLGPKPASAPTRSTTPIRRPR